MTEYLQADVRDPDAIVEGAKKVLDFGRPVALSLIALLHFVSDEDGAYDLVRRLVVELPSGSHLVVSHATADFTPEESKAATGKLKAAGVRLPCAPGRSSPASSTAWTSSSPASRCRTGGIPSWGSRSSGRTTG